jgi:hypothetical protein
MKPNAQVCYYHIFRIGLSIVIVHYVMTACMYQYHPHSARYCDFWCTAWLRLKPLLGSLIEPIPKNWRLYFGVEELD